ncbi:uncharacterized protein ACA1_066260 [Acanthamoeba castellanii str. Neff]|uniref:Apple domain-containing protein n=1 Tax=Acanthamoeba castellanii (strain ATCC 30010 / Neff) TaxID=1257118 RepID=L8GX08_ACACF|nr:uncharacterized protein ACA1_066260 [Acanthamoeba castellanii str. Neff]ELR17804.1 hypothetical protein ACA1_066260 [Acanthamoeba castellanii str. Neff]
MSTPEGRGTATLIGLGMIVVIAAVFIGIYLYFKKKNSTYTTLKDQQIPCGNLSGSCDLVQGGVHVTSDQQCQSVCDTTSECNGWLYDRLSNGSGPNCWVKYVSPLVPSSAESLPGWDMGYKITATS